MTYVMPSDVRASQAIGTGAKHERDKKIQNLPDYLRYVARKSRAGFDKVHDELIKLYTTEKSSQHETSVKARRNSPECEKNTPQAISPNLDNNSTSLDEGKQRGMSLRRKQWVRSAKTKTLWVTSHHLPTTGSFVSYISEDIEKGESADLKRVRDIEALQEELNPRTRSSEHESIPTEPDFGSKSYSANQVNKDKPMFTFDKLSSSKSLDYDQGMQLNSNSDSYSDSCPDYINIQGFSLHCPQNTEGPVEESDDIYDVPKASMKPPVKPRKVTKTGKGEVTGNVIDKDNMQNVSSTMGNPLNETNNSKRKTIEDDYMPMDDVDHVTSPTDKRARDTKNSDTDCAIKSRLDRVADSGDYVLPDTCRDQTVSKTSGYTGLEQNREDNLYTSIQKHGKPKHNMSNVDDGHTDMRCKGGLSGSGDYVLPDSCIDKTRDTRSGYTGLDGNKDENLYTPIMKKGNNKTKVPEVEDIYANSTSVLYDDFDNLRENDVLSRQNCENVYDIPPSLPNITKKLPAIPLNASKKKFYKYSVSEVVECLNACALPHLASICEKEQLDGYFFKNFNEGEMIKEPFLLNWFHIAKLRRIISGWRPKQ